MVRRPVPTNPHRPAPPAPPAPPTRPAHHSAAHAKTATPEGEMTPATTDEGSNDDCSWCADVADQLIYAMQAVVAYWRSCCAEDDTDRADCVAAVRSALDVIYPKLG